MSGADRVEVGPRNSLPAGERTIVEVNGHDVGVFNVDGEYYALLNKCPHERGPVCDGSVRDILEAEWPGPGERVVEDYGEKPAISCPWHGWELDMETGEHVGDPACVVPTFDVITEDGTLYVEP